MRLEPITHRNSTVDGFTWPSQRFDALDFGANIHPDDSYRNGCLKYLPCALDDDPTCGHRVRSKFPNATPVQLNGQWFWQVNEEKYAAQAS